MTDRRTTRRIGGYLRDSSSQTPWICAMLPVGGGTFCTFLLATMLLTSRIGMIRMASSDTIFSISQ